MQVSKLIFLSRSNGRVKKGLFALCLGLLALLVGLGLWLAPESREPELVVESLVRGRNGMEYRILLTNCTSEALSSVRGLASFGRGGQRAGQLFQVPFDSLGEGVADSEVPAGASGVFRLPAPEDGGQVQLSVTCGADAGVARRRVAAVLSRLGVGKLPANIQGWLARRGLLDGERLFGLSTPWLPRRSSEREPAVQQGR